MQLTEIEMRILAELEEAGEENVMTLLNTMFSPTGAVNELDETLAALGGLVQKGLMRMSGSVDASRRLVDMTVSDSLATNNSLARTLFYDEDKKLWRDRRYLAPPFGHTYPYAVYTEAGKSEGRRILTERGYQWWRQKR